MLSNIIIQFFSRDLDNLDVAFSYDRGAAGICLLDYGHLAEILAGLKNCELNLISLAIVLVDSYFTFQKLKESIS